MRAALALAVLLVMPAPAAADDYLPRGLGHEAGAVHWYDPGCCSMRDCEPVEPGAIRQTEAGYAVRYLSSRGFLVEGLIPYGSSAVRPSRDEREHACATTQRVLCIYLPFTM